MDTRSKRNFPITKLTDLKQLPNKASSFLSIHRRTLNIKYIDCEDLNNIFNKDLQNIDLNIFKHLNIKGLTRNELTIIRNDMRFEDLNDDEKTIALYLNDVIINDPLTTGIRETLTDDFVNYLLTELKFNKYPFSLKLQHDYSFKVFDEKVTAKIEFSIEKNLGVVCFSEDKHLNGIDSSSEYGESQIAAEILACAYNNYNKADSPSRGKDQVIYTTRVIGSRFTFYKAFVSSYYIESLNEWLPPDIYNVSVLRFPPQEKSYLGYDYANEKERPIIIELLLRLREQIRIL